MEAPKFAWFCLRTQLKHEHIAAAHLRQQNNTDVFVPRIRFQRKTRHGKAWVTEALFPNYLFARFDWNISLRQVYHTPGVSEVVHFGSHWPVIPDSVIEDLRASLGTEDVHVISDEMSPGDAVKIVGGSFHGFEAIVDRVLPSAKRVAVLMEFLGRQTAVELELDVVIKQMNEHEVILGRNPQATTGKTPSEK